VRDVPKIGDNYTIPAPEVIDEGDFEFSYTLDSLALEKRVGNSWRPVSTPLFGAWQFTQGGEPKNTNLMLWSRTPFDYAREIGNQLGWATAINSQWDTYPCGGAPPVTVCVDFEGVDVGHSFFGAFAIDGVVFVGHYGSVDKFDATVCDTTRKLPILSDDLKQIYLPEPASFRRPTAPPPLSSSTTGARSGGCHTARTRSRSCITSISGASRRC
jgi:hypothetical protein